MGGILSNPVQPANPYLGKPRQTFIGRVIASLGVTMFCISLGITIVFADEKARDASVFFYYFPFLKDGGYVIEGLIGGVILSFWGCLLVYDGEPLPDDLIPAPKPLLVANEPWRQSTPSRFLENLKTELKTYEEAVVTAYERAVKAHNRLPTVKGKIDYSYILSELHRYEKIYEFYQKEINNLKSRIQKIAEGDVRADVLDQEAAIQKLKRERQELVRRLQEVGTQAKTAQEDKEESRYWLHRGIKNIDINIIELETNIKELKAFDFKSLYPQLGIAADFASVENEDLQTIKAKADIINSFTPTTPTSTEPKEHPDDSKMNTARQRRKRDFQWEVETKAGVKVDKLDALQRWKKMKRKEILTDSSLTADEQEEQLNLLDKSYNEHKRKLESDFSIFEEE